MATQYVNTFILCQRTKNRLPSCNVASVTAAILQAKENFCTAAKIIALTTIHVFRDATPLSVGK
jgi:predicted membrane-bound dolichyl-phosphate-mannose-protein mannosyltransferase